MVCVCRRHLVAAVTPALQRLSLEGMCRRSQLEAVRRLSVPRRDPHACTSVASSMCKSMQAETQSKPTTGATRRQDSFSVESAIPDGILW